MKKKFKYQSVLVTLAAGFVGRTDKKINLDHTYPKVTGIAIVEPTSNNESYSIGVADTSEEYHSIAHKKMWLFGDNVAPNERYIDSDIDLVADRPLYIKINAETALTAETKFEVFFKTEKDA